MGTKEGTCDEHWMLCVSDESLNSTPETNIALYVNQLKSKFKKRRKKYTNQIILFQYGICWNYPVIQKDKPGTLGINLPTCSLLMSRKCSFLRSMDNIKHLCHFSLLCPSTEESWQPKQELDPTFSLK